MRPATRISARLSDRLSQRAPLFYVTASWISTRAYQGTAGGVESELISRLERSVVGDTIPDLTIMFDLDARASLLRSKGAAIGDERFERKGIAFHERVRHGFLAIARSEPERCVVVDSAADTATVARAVWQAVERVLPKR